LNKDGKQYGKISAPAAAVMLGPGPQVQSDASKVVPLKVNTGPTGTVGL